MTVQLVASQVVLSSIEFESLVTEINGESNFTISLQMENMFY
jgi:hypothetical protein